MMMVMMAFLKVKDGADLHARCLLIFRTTNVDFLRIRSDL